MKTFLKFFMLFSILLVFAAPPGVMELQAQTTITDSAGMKSVSVYVYRVYTAGILKNTDTVISKTWGREDFDSTYSFYFKMSSTTDSAKATVILQDSPDGTNWRTLRTLMSAIDTTTLQYKEDVFTEVPRYYRYVIYGVTGNGWRTGYQAWLYCRRL